MKNTKRSIAFKVIIGYLLLAALAGIAVWFIYTQVVKFSEITRSNSLNNKQLVLVSEIATELHETESTGRRFIQSGAAKELDKYSNQIASIQNSIDSLRNTYADSLMRVELDSISTILAKKGDNLEELLKLRSQDRNTSYYKEVIEELGKVDESFKDPNYEERFSNLEPHQRRVLIRLLEFSKDENSQQSSMSADSLVISVKKVLSELERQNQQFRSIINKKENELLENDMILNEQLRNLLTVIEQEERETSIERVENTESLLKEVSTIIIIVGIACILIILLFLVLIVKDISRSQRYRLQLEEAKSFTESLMKRREQFMATITHDLRSPLNTVIGYTELIGNTDLSSKQENYLKHVQKSSEYILHLVNDLLDLSKLEAGKMEIEKLPFNPKNLLSEVLFSIIPEDNNKGIHVNIDAPEETDCIVLSDPFRIKQILSNLISNSYKFTETGSITGSLSLQQEIGNDYFLTIRIKDTGIGISKSQQEGIFEEFSQEDKEIEKKYGGTGLGLAITKRIAGLLKGEISLNSDKGKGSEFILKIPVKKLEEEVTIAEPEEIPDYNLSGKNILVVDDESSQLALAKELIKSVGMHCDIAGNGKEAISLLERKDYHLVLTDIQMPLMDGFELVKTIKNIPSISNTPVIAVSGQTNVDPEVYKNAGFISNLSKPYKPRKLLDKIGEVLHLEFSENNDNTNKRTAASADYSLEDILLFAGNDSKALNTIIIAFVDSTQINIKEISHALNNGNYKRIAEISHRMLPMFKQLKANELILELQELELNPQSAERDKILNLLERIEQLLEKLKKEIKA